MYRHDHRRPCVPSDVEVVVSRRLMWNGFGSLRTDRRLQRVRHRVRLLFAAIDAYCGNFRLTGDLLALRNPATVAVLTVRLATLRRESRA